MLERRITYYKYVMHSLSQAKEVIIVAKKASGTRVRDAKNGRFLPKGTDKRRPATTVKETVKPRKKCR